MKNCSKCKQEKPLSEYWKHPTAKNGLTPSCKSCHRNAASEWRKNNPDKAILKRKRKSIQSLNEPYRDKKNRHLKHTYGINIEEWDLIFLYQNGCCAICKKHQRDLSRILQTDHDHKTGKVRGLLCTKCNTKLASIEDECFLISAKTYLAEFGSNK